MINEFLVASISLSFLFGGSDEVASPVKGDSAFTCAQINQAAGKRDYGSVNEMLDLSVRRLDEVYIKDSTIEKFYRNRLRGRAQRYRDLFTEHIVEACVREPKLGILEASTKALNNAYEFSRTNPLYAICKAYNDNEIDYGSLMALSSRPYQQGRDNASWLQGLQWRMDFEQLLEIQRIPSYGDGYLQNQMSTQCTAKPNESAFEVLIEIGRAAHQDRRQKAEAESEARRRAYSEEQKDVMNLLKRLEEEDEKNEPGMGSANARHEDLNGDYSLYKDSKGDYKASAGSHQEPTQNHPYKVETTDSTSLGIREIVASSTYASSKPAERLEVSSAQQSMTEPAAINEFQGKKREITVNPSSKKDDVPVSMLKAAPFDRIAVINDPDGYTNVRIAANGKSKIIARILQNERFHTYEQQGTWWAIRKVDGLLGYVHKSRISMIP